MFPTVVLIIRNLCHGFIVFQPNEGLLHLQRSFTSCYDFQWTATKCKSNIQNHLQIKLKRLISNVTKLIIILLFMDLTVWHFCHLLKNPTSKIKSTQCQALFKCAASFCACSCLLLSYKQSVFIRKAHILSTPTHSLNSPAHQCKSPCLTWSWIFNSFHFSCCPLTGFNSLPWQPRSKGGWRDVFLVSAANRDITRHGKGFRGSDVMKPQQSVTVII